MRTLSLLTLLAVPAVSHAWTCDVLTLDEGDNDVIVGEWLQPVTFPGWPPLVFWIPTGQSAVCWTDDVGVEHLELISSCGKTTPVGDGMLIDTLGGDDWVAVLHDAHLGGAWERQCGNRPDVDGKIGPWRSDFSFGLYLLGGTGSDMLSGSPNADLLISNDFSAVADDAPDLMCGWGGDDGLYGDLDDSTYGVEEFCDGGAGLDTCYGDFLTGGSSSVDVSSNNETWGEVWNGVTSGAWSPAVMCDRVDDPVSEWDAVDRHWPTF